MKNILNKIGMFLTKKLHLLLVVCNFFKKTVYFFDTYFKKIQYKQFTELYLETISHSTSLSMLVYTDKPDKEKIEEIRKMSDDFVKLTQKYSKKYNLPKSILPS